jgi:hypothetical protein
MEECGTPHLQKLGVTCGASDKLKITALADAAEAQLKGSRWRDN